MSIKVSILMLLALSVCIIQFAICQSRGEPEEPNNNGLENEMVTNGDGASQSYSEQALPVYRFSANELCAVNECAVMGMQRYSEPWCEPRGSVGQPCRPGAEPDSKTLHFPNFIVEAQDVYMQFCPCAQGLVCSESTMTCRRARNRFSARRARFGQRLASRGDY